MGGSYSGVGLGHFVDDLKGKISSRIDRFYSEMQEQYKDDPEALGPKPREVWVQMYLDWSNKAQKQRAVQQLAEQYLLGNFPDEENT